MKDNLNDLIEIWIASDRFLEEPTEENRHKFYRTLQHAKDKRHKRQRQRVTRIFVLAASVLLLCGFVFAILSQINSSEERASKPTVVSLVDTPNPICGGKNRIPITQEDRYGFFRREHGISIYNSVNTSGAILNNRIRAVAVGSQGVWFGYFSSDSEEPINQISQLNRESLENCQAEENIIGQNVNDIAVSSTGEIWVAMDGSGVAKFDGIEWVSYDIRHGLPDNRTYSISFDKEENVWVGTWEGLAKFDGFDWTTPYTTEHDTLVSNHAHSALFHPSGEIWVGYIQDGLSRFTQTGQWIHYSTEEFPFALASNNIRDIALDKSNNIWIATDAGGISFYNYETDEWSIFNKSNSSLPGDNIIDIDIDKYNRIWAATNNGVAYFNDGEWDIFIPINVLSIALGANCTVCPYNDENIWLGTEMGLAHSRLPALSNVIDIIETAYPAEVFPEQTFNPQITIRVLPGYELKKGDGLFFKEVLDTNLYGAYPIIPVTENINAGQTFTFVDSDNPMKAPQEPGIYTSRWQVWASGKYVGEEITIEFEVVENIVTQTP